MLVHPLNHIKKPSVLLYSIQAVFLSLLLFSCAYSPETEFLAKDSNGFEILMSQFANDIENTWGSNEVLIAGPKDYVKYTDQYQTRSHINFDKGIITIETLATTEPQQCLQKAIIKTLLMSEEPNNETLFGDQNISVNQQPLLYEQVLDHQRQPICSQWHADQFSQYLLDHSLSKRITGFRQIWAVNIPLVAHHLDYRVHKYISIVRRASRQYKVDQSLILAIIQTESSFNPYAVSYANALGLMQVVPTSAGRDVFSLVKNRRGKPARRYLFNPENNIDTGTAYLYLLQNVYLSGISNPMSRRYAVISAYNSGAGSVLRTFSPDKNEAVTIINTLSPDQVYQTLTTQHPSVQARHYLQKVTRAHRQYRRTV